MKLIILFISFLVVSTHAADISARVALTNRIADYATKNSNTLEGPIARDFDTLAAISLTKKDLELLKNAIKTLLILDDMDPSRSHVQRLYFSYEKNKALYNKAFIQVRNSLKSLDQKKQLSEIQQMLSNPGIGNG